MSDNTRNSGGSLKKSLLGRGSGNSPNASNSFKSGLTSLGGKLSSSMDNLMKGSNSVIGKMGNRNASVYTKGVRELDHNGFERYNIGSGTETEEIYISVNSERALFNEGQPILQRASDGAAVGTVESQSDRSAPVVEEDSAKDPRSYFGSNARPDNEEIEIPAIIGTVGGDGNVVPRPMDTGFLGKIGKVDSSNFVQPPRMVIEDDPVVEVPVVEEEHTIAPVVEEVPAPEPIIVEVPVEMEDDDSDEILIFECVETGIVNEIPEDAPATCGFIEIEETPVEDVPVVEETVEFDIETEEIVADIEDTPVEDVPVTYGFIEREEPMEAPVVEETVEFDIETEETVTIIEETTEMEIEEIITDIEDVVESPVEDVPITYGFIEREEPMEAPVVEDVVEAEEIIAEVEPTEEVAEETVEDAPMVAVMSVPGISGLITEEIESESPVETGHIEYETKEVETAEATSSDAAAPKCAIDHEGEGRPKMTPPKVSFKFINGRLVKVENPPAESEEGLPRPLE